MRIEGEVFTGRGEGAEYIGIPPYQRKIEEITGFRPFPGTLNLYVDPEKVEALREEGEPEVIEEFSYNGMNCSRLEVYSVTINGAEAAYIDIEITDHGENVMELVAPKYLRDELDLKDGDRVEIQFDKSESRKKSTCSLESSPTPEK